MLSACTARMAAVSLGRCIPQARFRNSPDLAPMVGAALDMMDADTRKMRGVRPYGFTNMKTGAGVDVVASFIVEKGGLEPPRAVS